MMVLFHAKQHFARVVQSLDSLGFWIGKASVGLCSNWCEAA